MNLKDLELPFPEDCIEWRILQSGKSGDKFWGMAAAYVSARAVMDRLDLVCGKENWKSEYYPMFAEGISPGIICNLSIKVSGDWVTKQDGSEQSDNDPFKGGISGALKRAAVHWGIGRYLYDLEQGFVTIVEKGTKGAKMGQTKDKERYYWLPPKLPEWALPKKEGNESSGRKAAVQESLNSTAPYKPPFGKYKGLPLYGISKEDLQAHKAEVEATIKAGKLSGSNVKLAEQLILELDKEIGKVLV